MLSEIITRKSALAAAIVAGMLASFSAPAMAINIYFGGTEISVRSGPGENFPVQGRILSGDVFLVDDCRNNFCFAMAPKDGLTGWIPQARYSSTPTVPGHVYQSHTPDPRMVIATAKLNLRSGPGQNNLLLGQVPNGERLNKSDCRNQYCFVTRENGYRGWALASALMEAPALGDASPSQPPAEKPPLLTVPLELVQVQDASSPPPFLPVSEACFYEHANYQGRSLCYTTGSEETNLANLRNWNDTISSIRISGGYSIQVFEHANFRGDSINVEKNMPNLGAFNDKISSFVVYAMH